MNRHKLKQMHGNPWPFSVWIWILLSIAGAGILVALHQKSAAGLLTTAVVLIIIAKHIGLVAILLGPLRYAWWRLTRRTPASAASASGFSVLAVPATQTAPSLDQLRVIGHALLNEFRTRAKSVREIHDREMQDPAKAPFNQLAPDMALVDQLAAQLRDWEAAGAVKLDQPRAAAGLLVTATFGMAAIELLRSEPVMDEAVDGFAGVIWNGLVPRENS